MKNFIFKILLTTQIVLIYIILLKAFTGMLSLAWFILPSILTVFAIEIYRKSSTDIERKNKAFMEFFNLIKSPITNIFKFFK